MDTEDRKAIEGLFQRLAQVEQQSGPRDPEAEAFIRDALARTPGAAYYMAQTIVMQDYALQEAERRVTEAEARAAERPAGGLFGGLFGGGRSSVPQMPRGGSVPRAGMPGGMPGQMPGAMGGGMGGGGFLAGAAQTAMGVAGGMLLGSAIASMFAPDPAAAAAPEEDPGADEPGMEEDGGLFGGGGFFGDEEF